MRKRILSAFLTACFLFTCSEATYAQESTDLPAIFEPSWFHLGSLYHYAFRINFAEVTEKYIFDYQRGLYSECADWGPFAMRFFELLKVVPRENQGNRVERPSDKDYGERLKDPEDLILFFQDGSKITYTFYERAIEVHGEALDGTPLFSPGYEITQPDVYAHFLDFIKMDRLDNEYNLPLWLGTMNPKKIVSVDIQNQTAKQTRRILPINQPDFNHMISSLRNGPRVKPGSFRQIKKNEIKGEYIIKLTFKSNVNLTIRVDPKKLEISASNMDYICSYDLRDASYPEFTRSMNDILNPEKELS